MFVAETMDAGCASQAQHILLRHRFLTTGELPVGLQTLVA